MNQFMEPGRVQAKSHKRPELFIRYFKYSTYTAFFILLESHLLQKRDWHSDLICKAVPKKATVKAILFMRV